MDQRELPTQPASCGDLPPFEPCQEQPAQLESPRQPGTSSDQRLVFRSVCALLVVLLAMVTTAFVVTRGRLAGYQHRVAIADSAAAVAKTAESARKRSFESSGLHQLYSHFEDSLAEVTRTGNAIDDSPSELTLTLYPAYQSAMDECRSAAATYNTAARQYPVEYFRNSTLPALIDVGDPRTNCIDDPGES